jgi:bacitracin transport system permease protein
MTTPAMMERYIDKADAFDGLFNMVLGYGIQFLLPCIIGVIAAMLFFMERDNDTFKNLRTIPVTSTQMVLAKIMVLFLFGIIFCAASTAAVVLCGMATLEVSGLMYKLLLAIETGIFITAGTLPLIVLVVFFSRAYVFSILLCVFYSVLNMSATALFDTLPKRILWLLSTPLTTFWSAGDMAKHGINMDLEQIAELIPSTFQVVLTLGIMAVISVILIDQLYKRRGE